MAFEVSTLTTKGTELLATATVNDRFIVTGCAATNTALSLAQAQAVQTVPSSTMSNTTEITELGSTINSISCRAYFRSGSTSGGDAKTLYLYGYLQSNPSNIFVLYVVSNSTAFHLPDVGDITNEWEIVFNITYNTDTDVVQTSTQATYATSAELNSVEDRMVTTHKLNQPTVGDDQTIYGKKFFKDSIIYYDIPAWHTKINSFSTQETSDTLPCFYLGVSDSNKTNYLLSSSWSTFLKINGSAVDEGEYTNNSISIVSNIYDSSTSSYIPASSFCIGTEDDEPYLRYTGEYEDSSGNYESNLSISYDKIILSNRKNSKESSFKIENDKLDISSEIIKINNNKLAIDRSIESFSSYGSTDFSDTPLYTEGYEICTSIFEDQSNIDFAKIRVFSSTPNISSLVTNHTYHAASLEVGDARLRVVDDVSVDHSDTRYFIELYTKSHQDSSNTLLFKHDSLDYSTWELYDPYSEDYATYGFSFYSTSDSDYITTFGLYPVFRSSQGRTHRSEIGSEENSWDRVCSETFIITPPSNESNIANTVTLEHRGVGTNSSNRCSWVMLSFSPNSSTENKFIVNGTIECNKVSNNNMSIESSNRINLRSKSLSVITTDNPTNPSTYPISQLFSQISNNCGVFEFDIADTNNIKTKVYLASTNNSTTPSNVVHSLYPIDPNNDDHAMCLGTSNYKWSKVYTRDIYATNLYVDYINCLDQNISIINVNAITSVSMYTGNLYGTNGQPVDIHGTIPHTFSQSSSIVTVDVGTILLLAIAGFTESYSTFYFYAGNTVSANSTYYGLYVGMLIQTGSTNSQYFSFSTSRRITTGTFTLLSDANRMNTGADRIFVLAMRTA